MLTSKLISPVTRDIHRNELNKIYELIKAGYGKDALQEACQESIHHLIYANDRSAFNTCTLFSPYEGLSPGRDCLSYLDYKHENTILRFRRLFHFKRLP
jgi:hypothetical protein